MPIYVKQWPTQFTDANGNIQLMNSPMQDEWPALCQAAGYILGDDPNGYVVSLRQQYAQVSNQFCSVAGITVVDVLAAADIASAIQAQTLGSAPRMALDELALELEALTLKLTEADRADALNRIS